MPEYITIMKSIVDSKTLLIGRESKEAKKQEANKAIGEVKRFGNYSGHITLPGAWIGKRVEVRIIEE